MKLGLGVFAGLILISVVSTCNSKPKAVSMDVIASEYAKGLDLQAVTNLARTSKTPQELEEKLNSSSTGVNNIDLNDDDKVDYINVTEFGEGSDRGFSLTTEISPGNVQEKLNSSSTGVNNIDLNDDDKVDYINVTEFGDGSDRGFSLTTEISPGNVQEIATIQFSPSGDQVAVQTTGHSSLYGNNRYYRSSFGLSDALLWSYVLSNHSSYRSPYGYGNYPGSYGGGWSRSSNSAYASGNSRYRGMSPAMPKGTPPIKSAAVSPNANKQAARAKMVSNPKQSQRSFAKRTGTSRGFGSSRSSGGFGRSSSSSSSRSSFGGGK